MAVACRTWRALGSSSCLWSALDLRAHRCDAEVASSLASRCGSLGRLRLWGHEAAAAASGLSARDLREVVADGCRGLTDATLAVLAARHEALESLQIGSAPLERVSSDAVRHVALCCSRLRLSGLRYADADAIGALAHFCPLLEDVAFLDCSAIDEAALAGIHSLRFLSIAGRRNLKWTTASASWCQLPSLIAVDVSRTDVSPSAISRLISHSKTLKLICTLNCKSVEEKQAHNPSAFSNSKGKLVLTTSLAMLLNLVESLQEDVQERAATTLATFVVIDDDSANMDAARSEAVMRNGGVPILLDLARC